MFGEDSTADLDDGELLGGDGGEELQVLKKKFTSAKVGLM